MDQVTAIPAPPARPDDAHKGTFGTVIVVGGCATMIGAPAICATAALRGGVGLCKIATEPRVLPFVLSVQPSATGIELGDDATVIDHADPAGRAVLAIGPGLSTAQRAAGLIEPLLFAPHHARPYVLDADGLNLLAETGRRLNNGVPRVLTPHPGEFRKLAQPLGITHDSTDETQRPDAAGELATLHRSTVVLKGHRTVVSDGQRVFMNDTGNAALATAGSGDVLTGLIAALLAQGMDAFDAAVLGVHAHGLAADNWAQQFGASGMTAMDLAERAPAALHTLRTK
jgi:NAD(P)H-hydrate epimerase